MDSVAETSFLVGAEFASMQASSRLAEAELQVKEEMDKAAQLEQELLFVEKENIENWGKKKEENEKVRKTQIDIDSIKKHVESLSDVQITQQDDDIKITSIGEMGDKDERSNPKLFDFLDNSDDQIKITIKEKDSEDEDLKNADSLDSDTDKEAEEPPKYKFPTF